MIRAVLRNGVDGCSRIAYIYHNVFAMDCQVDTEHPIK